MIEKGGKERWFEEKPRIAPHDDRIIPNSIQKKKKKFEEQARGQFLSGITFLRSLDNKANPFNNKRWR